MDANTPRSSTEDRPADIAPSTVLQGFTDLANTMDNPTDNNISTKLVKAIGLVQLGLARATSEIGTSDGAAAHSLSRTDPSSMVAPFTAGSLSLPFPPESSPATHSKLHMFSHDGDVIVKTQELSGHLKAEEYAALIELLASALRDEVPKRATTPAIFSGHAAHSDGPLMRPRSPDLDRDCMERGWKGKARALGRRALSRTSPPPPGSSPPITSNDEVPSIVGLLQKNLRLIARLLRTPTPSSSLIPQLVISDTSPKMAARPGGDRDDEDKAAEPLDLGEGTSQKPSIDGDTAAETVVEASPLLRLPPELQRRIFQLARKFSEDASAWVTPSTSPHTVGGDGNKKGIRSSRSQNINSGVTEINFSIAAAAGPVVPPPPPPPPPPGNQVPEFLDLDGFPIPPPGMVRSFRREPKGGRRKAQEYAHSLASICRSLHSVSRRAAFDSVHIRTRRQVIMLVKLWKGEFDEYDNVDEAIDAVFKAPTVGSGEETLPERRRRRPVLSPSRGWDNSPMSSVDSFDTIVSDPAFKNKASGAANDGSGEGEGDGNIDSDIINAEKESKAELLEQAKLARRADLRNAGAFVRYLNIEVPAATDELDRETGNSRPPRRRFRRGRNGYGYTGLRTAPDLNACLAELQASRKAAIEAEKGQLPELFALVPNLWELTLCVQPCRSSPSFGGGFTAQGYGSESLENDVLTALCGLKGLRKLTLRQSVDFTELEVLMPCLPELQELRLDGGMDNVDGRGDIDPEAEHSCRLQVFALQNFDFESGDVSADQLRWILGKSVGCLEHLDLIMYAGGGGAHPNWGNVEGGAATSPFACKTFADLLVQLGPTLKHLALRDCSSFGQTHADLANAPHNGFLDYALLHCTKLEHLAIEWFVTGTTLLDCLLYTPELMAELEAEEDEEGSAQAGPSDVADSDPADSATSSSTTATEKAKAPPIPHEPRPLKTMTFFGSPERTSAKNLADMLTRHLDTLEGWEGHPHIERHDQEESHESHDISLPQPPPPPPQPSSTVQDENHRHKAFPFLESITLSAFPTQRNGQFVPWRSRDLRKLREACQLRNVWLGFAS